LGESRLNHFIEDQPQEFWMEASHLIVSKGIDDFCRTVLKCHVSPKESDGRLSGESKIEISYTSKVGMRRFFLLAIMCCADESHRGESRNA
jgi:hypothetical protein